MTPLAALLIAGAILIPAAVTLHGRCTPGGLWPPLVYASWCAGELLAAAGFWLAAWRLIAALSAAAAVYYTVITVRGWQQHTPRHEAPVEPR